MASSRLPELLKALGAHDNRDKTKSLYSVLAESWTLDTLQAESLVSLASHHSVTASVKDYWRNVLDSRARTTSDSGHHPFTRSLISKIHRILAESGDIETQLCTIFNSAEPEIVSRLVFNDGGLPFRAYLAYTRLRARGRVPPFGRPCSVDEAIIENEEYLRRRSDNEDIHLLSVVDLMEMLGGEEVIADSPSSDSRMSVGSWHTVDSDSVFNDSVFDPKTSLDPLKVEFSRPDIPLTELPFLDDCRQPKVSFLNSNEAFKRRFNSATGHRFDSLNWANVVVVGDAVHAIFLKGARWMKHSDIEFRLYGLDAAEAADKVQQIFTMWRAGLDNYDLQIARVRRSPHAVVFGLQPRQSGLVQVSLQIRPTKTDILLDVGHDAWAMAFDGTRVLMLPRCARAIQTGYAVITSRLMLSEPVLDGHGQRESEIFHLAQDGYGLRVLPVYAKTLEDDDLDPLQFNGKRVKEVVPPPSEDPSKTNLPKPRTRYDSLQAFRKPQGQESGCKTMRRIAFLGQDRFFRTYYGPTPLASYLEERARNGEEVSFQYLNSGFNPSTARETFDMRSRKGLLLCLLNGTAPGNSANRDRETGPHDPYSLHQYDQHALGSAMPFEVFVGLSEGWSERLHYCCQNTEAHFWYKRGLAHSAWPPSHGNPVGGALYGPILSERHWYSELDHVNNQFFPLIQGFVFLRTGMDPPAQEYRKYLTSRIRIHQYADKPRSWERDLTIPLIINKEVEDLLSAYVPPGTIQMAYNQQAHGQPGNGYTGRLPPLPESDDELGNLRYLTLSTESMWRGSDSLQDQAMELLLLLASLSMLCAAHTPADFPSSFTKGMERWILPALLSRRASMFPQISETARWKGSVLTVKEARLFRTWVMAGTWHKGEDMDRNFYVEPFSKRDFLYPVPEDLFWGPEFEEGATASERVRTYENMELGSVRKPWWFRDEAYKELRGSTYDVSKTIQDRFRTAMVESDSSHDSDYGDNHSDFG